MYSFDISEPLDKVFSKLNKKNPKIFKVIFKKISEIIENPHHYKNLRKPLHHLKRIHIGKSFVLVFSVNEKEKMIVFEEFDHHDNVYR